MKMNKGPAVYCRAKRIIPGGTQLLSKRPEMFLPDEWPSYYKKCKGIAVWDLDGRKFRDFTIAGVGTCPLGYADPDVDRAVIKAVRSGNMSTLNAPEETELAELLCRLHPWAEMVRYARTGGEAMAIAVRIARAHTGREKILFCGYHGWHDWYLAANLAESSALDDQLLPGLESRGVPRSLRGTAIPFQYNDIASFQSIIDKHGKELAAVIMEPVRNVWPKDNFLQKIRGITSKKKIPLIFDEVTSGWRMTCGGIHLKMKIYPDICVFAKALGNGYPIAAIIGRAGIMGAAQRTFISSTYWTDKIGPTAALETIRKFQRCKAHNRLIWIGELVQAGWHELAVKYGLDIKISGIPPLSHWQVNTADSQLLHTIIVKKMLDKGFLTSKAFYSTYAHKEKDVKDYLQALDEVIMELSPFIKAKELGKIYKGRIAHQGFKRLT